MTEKWKVGSHPSTVVSDTKQINTNFQTPLNASESTDDEVDYYGGYLVCESVGSIEKAKLIASAPDLLENLIRCVARMEENEMGHFSAVERAREAIKKATE